VQELGLIRKPAAFISTISDERGQELLYAGMRISDVFKEDIGLGGVVSLLWFKRRMFLILMSKNCPFSLSYRPTTLGY
jgi:ATP citrate (pro-S)-lyase